ncbi:hypothetical protein D3OALGB2SA_5197 [Olavius algarvensis associated proteobacterium Delta 3]|nr:hypothetical protein D3OALGB2SA_5197 [Olavius algarvensis associated proteobacterium Delta 3]
MALGDLFSGLFHRYSVLGIRYWVMNTDCRNKPQFKFYIAATPRFIKS